MAHRRKPGTPGKTAIPRDVVKTVMRRLQNAFKDTIDADLYDLFVIAQQHYLYLETTDRPHELMPGFVDSRYLSKRPLPRKPLARMVWTGDPEKWHLQLYKWSDERWDEDNEAMTAGGTPEECMVEGSLGW